MGMQNLKKKESALISLIINFANCLRVLAGDSLLSNRREAAGCSELLRLQAEEKLEQESGLAESVFEQLYNEQWPRHELLGSRIAGTRELITRLLRYTAFLCSLNNTVRCINSNEPGTASVRISEAQLRRASKIAELDTVHPNVLSLDVRRGTGLHWNKPFDGEIQTITGFDGMRIDDRCSWQRLYPEETKKEKPNRNTERTFDTQKGADGK